MRFQVDGSLLFPVYKWSQQDSPKRRHLSTPTPSARRHVPEVCNISIQITETMRQKCSLNSWVKSDQLDVTYFIVSLFNAQHVSDVNTSILRSLRLTCWVISWVVLLLHTDTTPPQPNHNVTPTHIDPEQYNPWNNSTNKSQAPEDGCINIRNMFSIK